MLVVLYMVKRSIEDGDAERSIRDETDYSVNRRTYIKSVGLCSLFATGVGGPVAAAEETDSGYGEGGYGEGPYGGDDDPDDSDDDDSSDDGSSDDGSSDDEEDDTSEPTVKTLEASDVTTESATLRGELTTEDDETAEAYFEYRASDADSWTSTGSKTIDTEGTFETDVNTLEKATEYEFRAVAETSDEVLVGSTRTFSTKAVPRIDYFDTVETSPPNPHARIRVDWKVSHEDGDLASVRIRIESGDGTQTDSWSDLISGSSESDTNQFEFKHGSGLTYDVELTVTDVNGTSVREIQTVEA